ncbi:hypothetical protein CERSUDRAFT_78582 [Gelatoporia subvermispora B]|uniref:Uncharacterized protein n=1 Tax=Ceriporiopsis subvermispora (strain B) TaxID=914234 RepID=M2QY37_CERS8|nr:hypothetical protein CERSUDRAFT_78582 [Gelatoporia subvermispora B]
MLALTGIDHSLSFLGHHICNPAHLQVDFITQLPDDVILEHAGEQTVSCRKHLDGGMKMILGKFLYRVEDFRNFMQITRAIISGSCVASFFLRSTSIPPPGADLDVYCPFGQSERIGRYLEAVEGYTYTAVLPPALDYVGGIAMVHRYEKNSLQIDLVESLTSSAANPIPFFYGTHLVSWMSADQYCCAYPRLTFDMHSVLSGQRLLDWNIPDGRVLEAIRKYEQRGVQFALHAWQWADSDSCDRGYACPRTARWFGDQWCLVGSYSTYAKEIHRRTGSDVTSDLTVIWWRGGISCGGPCANPRDAVMIQSVVTRATRDRPISYVFYAAVVSKIPVLHILSRLAKELEFSDPKSHIYTMPNVPLHAVRWWHAKCTGEPRIPDSTPASSVVPFQVLKLRVIGMVKSIYIDDNGLHKFGLEVLRRRDLTAGQQIGVIAPRLEGERSYHPIYDGTASITDGMPQLRLEMIREDDVVAIDCELSRTGNREEGWKIVPKFERVVLIHATACEGESSDSD